MNNVMTSALARLDSIAGTLWATNPAALSAYYMKIRGEIETLIRSNMTHANAIMMASDVDLANMLNAKAQGLSPVTPGESDSNRNNSTGFQQPTPIQSPRQPFHPNDKQQFDLIGYCKRHIGLVIGSAIAGMVCIIFIIFLIGIAVDDTNTAEEVDGVSLEQYEAIRDGMSYKKVVDIIGYDGVEVFSIGDDYGSYVWPGNGGGNSSVSITFRDGKVESKIKLGGLE